jgi:hypothetical protein
LNDVEFNPFPFRKGLEALTLDGGVMDKDIAAIILRDEPEALRIVEPLYRSLRHLLELLLSRIEATTVTSKKPLSHDSRTEVNNRFHSSLAPLNNMSYKSPRGGKIRPLTVRPQLKDAQESADG